MTKKTFFAQQWLQREVETQLPDVPTIPELRNETCALRSRFPSFIHHRQVRKNLPEDNKFSPLHCFIPGWKGDSLSSKTVLKFERLMSVVQLDVKNELLRTKDFTKTIKVGLYSEFLSYAESLGFHFEGMDDFGRFWQFMNEEHLAQDERLSRFVDIYCGRVATINFLKLRFVGALIDRCGLEVSDKALSPTSWLAQIFKKGSQYELNSRALESNHYSWYRPLEGMKETMKELLVLSKDLAITEIIKNVSGRTQISHDQGRVYSHALSQVSVGLFLNSLQINFPMWLGAIEGRALPPGGLEQEGIISCKYYGDFLESLSLSHWLAQENNMDFRWDEILCPDFKGKDFSAGTFTKVCNELQFLTFLANKAQFQSERPIDYICRIMGGHLKNRKNSSNKQGLILEQNPFYSSTYDRVVLNLCHFPKNNPQHYLMAQILDQVRFLKNDGYLFVLSNKKLFVPSLRDRLEPVLRELKTEAIIDLENVKGKGELGSYLYIFRKKQNADSGKQLCSYFRISGELQSFTEFSAITEHMRSFYLANLTDTPAMTQLEFSDSFRLEYYQEAVVNGMLIHSTNEDSSRITHPTYFKGLLESCVPLETLFEIKSLSMEEKNFGGDNALNLGLKRDLAYFLVVDFRKDEVNIELHPMDTLRSIHSEFGEALCSYFHLQPKLSGLNPNIIRNYFLTPIGKQVAQLTFTGGPSLVKGSLSKFLVPRFLTDTDNLPEQLRPAFKIFEMTEKEFLEHSPQTVMKSFNHTEQITRDVLPRYACEILSRYSTLEMTLKTLIWKIDDGRFGHKISFNNPMVQSQLVQKQTRPLYPENVDIFLEFVDGSTPVDIHLPLTTTQIKVTHEGELKLYSLEIISRDKVVVRLHAEETMVLFLNFILSQACNVPISKILRAVHVPSLEDLKSVIESTQSLKETYQELLGKVQTSIAHAFRAHVTTKRAP